MNKYNDFKAEVFFGPAIIGGIIGMFVCSFITVIFLSILCNIAPSFIGLPELSYDFLQQSAVLSMIVGLFLGATIVERIAEVHSYR